MLRTYTRMEITRSSGAYMGGGTVTSPEISVRALPNSVICLQLFTDPDLPAPNYGDLRFEDASNAEVNLLTYTFSFGNGLSATLSLEDGIGRRWEGRLRIQRDF